MAVCLDGGRMDADVSREENLEEEDDRPEPPREP